MAQRHERAFREIVRKGDHDMGLAELRLESEGKGGQVHCPDNNGKPLKEVKLGVCW